MNCLARFPRNIPPSQVYLFMAGPDSRSTHASLLIRLRNLHDAGAWQLFVSTYAPLIYRYCRRQGLQEADTSDVTQEVLSQVTRSIATFDYQPERGRFRDWLGAVVRSKLARHHQKRARLRTETSEHEVLETLDETLAAETDSEWVDDFNAHLLQVAFERIKADFEPTNWRAFEMVWIENKPAAEIASTLGMTPSALYVAKWRVLKRLREEILLLADDVPHLVPLGEGTDGP
jgi:RNA polymerase sigma factor (sigma-70 family)